MDRRGWPRPESATLVAAERGRDIPSATRQLMTSRHGGVAHISIVLYHRRARSREPVACQGWNMKNGFEYMNYSNSDRLAMLENRAAELERRLGESTPDRGVSPDPAEEFGTTELPMFNPPADEMFDPSPDGVPDDPRSAGYRGYDRHDGSDGYGAALFGEASSGRRGRGYESGRAHGTGGYIGEANGYPDAGVGGPDGPDDRTEVLINRGRRNAKRGLRRWRAHWRAIIIGVAAVFAGAILLANLSGSSASWPASVARVKSQIAVACQNPNVVSEPSQVNFACAKETSQILWVFSLLTSGNNPSFTDPANGRRGLEPITPAQGGDIAWSLNLHHPYDVASPIDSLQVAARAINNIIGGATLTGSNGAPVVQPGLESKPANCLRYTGSSALVTRQGFPARCAAPVSSDAGQAALVSDVFKQWMVGAPTQTAAQAGVLFVNANNPGNSDVQAILKSLPSTAT